MLHLTDFLQSRHYCSLSPFTYGCVDVTINIRQICYSHVQQTCLPGMCYLNFLGWTCMLWQTMAAVAKANYPGQHTCNTLPKYRAMLIMNILLLSDNSRLSDTNNFNIITNRYIYWFVSHTSGFSAKGIIWNSHQ